MQRRSLLLLAPLLPLGLWASRYVRASTVSVPEPLDYREKALKLNELAVNVHSLIDARMLVHFVADIFSEQPLPTWIDSKMLAKVAQAEYSAATDSRKLVSEQKLAEAWNTYAQTIGTPPDHQVSAAEIHNLRETFYITAKMSWTRGMRTIWTVPSIYATREDGALAEGCRGIESARILWDLANNPGNLAAARVRVNEGVAISTLFPESPDGAEGPAVRSYISAGSGTRSPVADAQREYARKSGSTALAGAAAGMMYDVLS